MRIKEMLIQTMQECVRTAFDATTITNESQAYKCANQMMEEANKIAHRLVKEFGMTYAEVEALQVCR